MICPKCGKAALGPYVKMIKGNPYHYMAHYITGSRTKWCYVPKGLLLNPAFFKDGRFTRAAELSRLIFQLWEKGNLFSLKIKKMYIHGSQVKGTYAKGSDLDVWVEVEKGCEIPIVLTATKRMVAPPRDVPRLTLRDVEVEVSCASFKPNPPYFDIFEQKFVLK